MVEDDDTVVIKNTKTLECFKASAWPYAFKNSGVKAGCTYEWSPADGGTWVPRADGAYLALKTWPPAPSGAKSAADAIAWVCDGLKELLLKKNRQYGDSALNPIRCFSKADAEEQIRVRIDDKISRMMRGDRTGDTEDTEMDLMGYLVLLKARRLMA